MTTLSDPGIRFALRPYQDDALARMVNAEARGVRKQLGVAATGLGKTVIFCAHAAARGGRTLILAHRDELIGQTFKKVTEIWPEADVGIVKAEANDVDAHVVVASVQTLARERRMDQLLTAQDSLLRDVQPFDLVIVDEAHHSAADSYRRIIEALGAGEPEGPMLLGVTATPDRGDGQGLDDLFEEIVWYYDLLWGIRSGYLADVRAKRVVLDRLDLSQVRVRRGDYDAGQAGQALADADAPESIVRAWRQHAADRQTIVFTPTVDLARLVALEFQHHGIKAAMVSGETPLDERRSLLRAYANGEFQVVANCAVLTEGFDEPRTDCIVVARPTKSRLLFTQMIGRGTRRHPDKDHLLVLDVVGGTAQHSLLTVPSLFGLPEDVAHRVETMNLTDAVDEFEHEQVVAGRMRAEDADVFRKMRAQGIAWVSVDDRRSVRRYERTLSYRDRKSGERVELPTVVLAQRDTDAESWLCGLWMPNGEKRVLMADIGLELAQGVGEDYARKTLAAHGRAHYIELDADWRRRKPSPKAKKFARELGLTVKDYADAGALSDAIDEKLAQRRHRG